MTLRTKFIIVLLLLCAAVGINIAAAVYYSEFRLGRAGDIFRTTYEPAIVVRYGLDTVKELNGVINEAYRSGQFEPAQRANASAFVQVLRSIAGRLKKYDHVLERIGDPKQLQELLSGHEGLILEGLSGSVESGSAVLSDSFKQRYLADYGALQELLERWELDLNRSQFDRDAKMAQESAVKLYYVLFGMGLAEIAALVITFSFFRLWMVKPIGAIRTATEQIAEGNLDYRLTGLSNDELGALGGEVNHMAAALAVAQSELKQKERMAAVGEMVSVVAHNIRNPLAGIRATAQSCLHELEAGSAVSLQQARIIGSVDSLEQWLKELLHLNRPLELKIERISVDDVVADLKQIFQPSTQRKGIEIDYRPAGPGQSIGVDRQHFVQALASILDNAIAASPPSAVVGIRTGRKGAAQSGFFIEISDAGPGVPEGICRQIFDPYFSTKPGGTGIGLSMAKKIVEAHAGTLSVGNGSAGGGAERGAVFRIEIPDRGRDGRGTQGHG